MINKKLNIKKIETYFYFLIALIVFSSFFWLFTFLNKNAFETLTSSGIIIDANSIKIVDVDSEKFNSVLKNLENKSVKQNTSLRNVFD